MAMFSKIGPMILRPEDEDPFAALLRAAQAEGGGPDQVPQESASAVAPPPVALRAPEFTPRSAPPIPQFEDMPRRTHPMGFRARLKDALLGFVPGYVEAKEEAYKADVADAAARNKRAYDIFKEENDRIAQYNNMAERAAYHDQLAQVREIAEQRQREKMAAEAEYKNAVVDLKQQQLDQQARAQQYREQKRMLDYEADLQFITDYTSKHMKGRSPEDVQREIDRFMLRKGSRNPLEDKIEALKEMGIDPSREQVLNMAGATRQPPQSAPVVAVIAGPNGQQQPVLVDKNTGKARAIEAPGGGTAYKAPPGPTAATRQMSETATVIVPKIDAVVRQLDDPEFAALLGPVAGRWNEFMVGKVGTGDPKLAALRTTMGLITTGAMRAHVGARGGEGMLAHFKNLADARSMDVPTLKASLSAMRDFLKGYILTAPGAEAQESAPETDADRLKRLRERYGIRP